MKARVIVTLKSGVLDPQGKAIEGALNGLAVDGLRSVRQGKIFDIELDGDDHAAARQRLSDACERLLANTIVENYAIEIA
jgi:phosphoribosylformylglycinamidine synthase